MIRMLLITGLAVACAVQPPGRTPEVTSPVATATPTAAPGIAHPTDPAVVVLRMDRGGGLVPPPLQVAQLPEFSLYGDGRVICQPPSESVPNASAERPALLEALVGESTIQDLLTQAFETGRLHEAKEHYDHPRIADAPTTVFTVRTADVERTVSVYALGLGDPATPDEAERMALSRLADSLRAFCADLAAGDEEEVSAYDPPVYRTTLLQWQGGQPEVEWPWPELTPDDFDEDDAGGRSMIMERERVAQLASVPNGGVTGILSEDPAGRTWTIVVRPLLPEEID